jgi:hypothetical protein
MPADTSLLRRPSQDKLGSNGPALLPALRRMPLPAAAAKGDEDPPGEAGAVSAGLLDYAAFVLEQEARYCQQ